MSVRIHNLDGFAGLIPGDVVAYLRANGWADAGGRPGVASVWKHPGRGASVMVPLDPTYEDFAATLAEAVKLTAAVEGRDEPAVLEDMRQSGMDVVRVRVRESDAADGTMPLVERAGPLYAGVPDLMAAAASAAVDSRPRFGSSRPAPVAEFVRRLRLGQSERGSYVLKVLSPVPPRLGAAVNLLGETDEPFERRAVVMLGRALRAVRAAADEAGVSGRFEPFERAVRDGVSANLCEALVKIGGAGPGGEMAFHWTWAKTRPNDADVPREVTLPADRLPLLAEAARQFRATAPVEAVELQGFVVKLQTTTPDGPPAGPVTIHALADGVVRKVVVALSEADHRAAIDAYNRRATVVCTGDLVLQGSQYTLQNPRGFAVLPDD